MGGSSGSLAAAIQGADEKVTVLDDRVDAEDAATFLWMSAHRLTGHMHPRVAIGTERLSFAWDAKKKQFSSTASAELYLSDFGRDAIAMQTFSKIERSLNSSAPLVSDHAVVATVAAGLVSGRVWLIEIPRSSPKSRFVTQTSPEAFTAINAKYSTKVDFAFIALQEGGQWLRGYVPINKGKVMGQSGMTVATGFDVGQWNFSALQNLGFSKQLLDKLRPYVGVKFKDKTKTQVIQMVVKLGPVPELTKAEADACDVAVFGKALQDAISTWESPPSHRGVPRFIALPEGWQTVWLSRVYQEGPGAHTAFREAARLGHWQSAVVSLQVNTKYPLRAAQEAALLTKKLPSPPPTLPVP